MNRGKFYPTCGYCGKAIVAGGTEEADVPMHKTCLELWKTEQRSGKR